MNTKKKRRKIKISNKLCISELNNKTQLDRGENKNRENKLIWSCRLCKKSGNKKNKRKNVKRVTISARELT